MVKYLKILIFMSVILFFCYMQGFSLTDIFSSKGNVLDYKINVSTTDTAALKTLYHLKLEFNQDTDKITIKVPNKDLLVLSKDDKIKEISTDTFGNYIDVYLNRTYKNGETLTFNFTLKFEGMYKLKEDAGLCVFRFKAGKIKEFKCDDVKINWSKDNVYFSGISAVESGKYVLEHKFNLFYNPTLMMQYTSGTFDFKSNLKRSINVESFFENGYFYLVFFGVIVVTELIRNTNSYSFNRGFVYK